jgi:hypothetical protein
VGEQVNNPYESLKTELKNAILVRKLVTLDPLLVLELVDSLEESESLREVDLRNIEALEREVVDLMGELSETVDENIMLREKAIKLDGKIGQA